MAVSSGLQEYRHSMIFGLFSHEKGLLLPRNDHFRPVFGLYQVRRHSATFPPNRHSATGTFYDNCSFIMTESLPHYQFHTTPTFHGGHVHSPPPAVHRRSSGGPSICPAHHSGITCSLLSGTSTMSTIHTMTADELRETLRVAGYTQAEFARELDRSESFVSNLARGHTPMQLRYIQALRSMMGDEVFDASIRNARRCIVKGECDRAATRLSRRVTGGVRVRVTLNGAEDDEEQPRPRRTYVLSDDVVVSRPDEDEEDLDDEDIQDTLEDDDDTLEDDGLEDDDGSDDEDDDTLDDNDSDDVDDDSDGEGDDSEDEEEYDDDTSDDDDEYDDEDEEYDDDEGR
ncbi:MAG: helix-turn-helix transcriptional regulator ['Candidatus Kapabacteria' thiocyanatum]|nr:helix-turn-helix transcriptional regulator ['Candidatus Kapabacteria' thiocyanatum]